MSIQTQTSSISYSGAALGLAVTGASLASVNYEKQMIDAAVACGYAIGPAASTIVTVAQETLAQNSGAVVGGAIGTWIILNSLTNSENDSYLKSAYKTVRNAGFSLLGSFGMASLARTEIPSQAYGATRDFVMGPGKAYLDQAVDQLATLIFPKTLADYQKNLGTVQAIILGISVASVVAVSKISNVFEAKRRTEQLIKINELINKAEAGDKQALIDSATLIFNQKPNYLNESTNKRLVNLLKNEIKKLAKVDLAQALFALGVWFDKGVVLNQNKNAAYVCFQKAAELKEPNALQLMIAYTKNPWNPPINSDPYTEDLIFVTLGIEQKPTSAHPKEQDGLNPSVNSLHLECAAAPAA